MGIINELYTPNQILKAVKEGPLQSEEVLPPSQQEYANDVVSNLEDKPIKPITTEKEWKDLNKKESDRLMEEEEGFFENVVERAAIEGKTPKEISGIAKAMAALKYEAEERGIAHAAAISAEKNRLAVADIMNPQNASMDEYIRRHTHLSSSKRAILDDMINFADLEASKKGIVRGAWNLVKELIPGVRQHAYSEGLKSSGIGTDEINTLFSSAERLKEFRNTIGNLINDDTIGEMQFSAILGKMYEDMLKGGSDVFTIRDLFNAAKEFDPGLETFYDTLDYGFAAYGASKIGRGLGLYSKVSKAVEATEKEMLKQEAGKLIASGVEDATGIPFIGDVARVSSNKVNKLVTKGAEVYKNIPYNKTRYEKNRLASEGIVEELLDTPEETERIVKGYKTKEGAYEYGVDSTLHPSAKAGGSVANAENVLGHKIQKEFDERLDRAIKRRGIVEGLKRESFEKLAAHVADTLNADELLGAGRGVGTKEILSAFDNDRVLTSKTNEDIVILAKLKNPKDNKRFYSRVNKDGVDTGKENAIKKGKELADKANKLTGEFTTSYRVDQVGKSWHVTLEIDTHKGWGTIHYEMLAEDPEKLQRWRPTLSSLFTATSNPTDIQLLNIARNIDASSIRSMGETAKESFKKLSKKERAIVQGAIDVSTKYNAWYTPEHLLERGLSEDAVRAYENIRALNDYDDFVRNMYTRADLVRKGAKSVWFNGDYIKGAGREIRVADEDDLIRIVKGKDGKPGRDLLVDDLGANKKPQSLDEIGEGKVRELYRKGYKLIEGSLSPEDGFGARTFYYFLDSSNTIIDDLPEFVTSYVAGGRRFFDKQSTFIKQLRIDKTAKGRDAIVGTRTFFADLDGIGLARRTELLEGIRSAIVKGDLATANKIIQDAKWTKAPFYDADSFREFFEPRGMDFERLDNKLEAVANNEVLISYDRMKAKGAVEDLVGFDDMRLLSRNSHFQALSSEAKEKKLARTGRELLTWDFESAQPVDFEKQVQYLVNDMVFNGIMNHFTDFYAERFAKLYRGVVNHPKGSQATARELLLNGEVTRGLEGVRGDLAKSADTALRNFAAIRGIPTVVDRAIANNGRALMDWIGGLAEKVLPIPESAAHGVRVAWEKILEKDPLSYSRTLASHWYLGMFNITQLYKQTASDLAIFLLEPRASLKAGRYSLPFTSALYKSDGNLMKAMERLAKDFGDASPEVRQTFETLLDLGAFEHGVAGGFLETGQTVKSKLSKISMMPFNMGEMQNRVMSYLTAIEAKGYWGKKLSKAELADVALYGQKLFLNMDAPGLARIQTGTYGKTLLQFFGYRMRWLETVLFDKTLTKQQRLRLALGTSLLVGSEGMLGVTASSWITTNVYNLFTDPQEPPELERNELARFFQRGLLNYSSEVAGWNTDIAAPFSLEYGDLLDSVSGIATLDLASTQAATRAWQGIKELAKVIKDEALGEATYEDFENKLAQLAMSGKAPSSVRPFLGYLLWKNGRNYNTKGELTERTNSTLRAVLHGLGFNSLEVKDRAKAWVEWGYVKGLEAQTEKDYYTAILHAMKTNEPYDWNVANTLLKLSPIPERSKARIWRSTHERAGRTISTPLLQLQYNEQLKRFNWNESNVLQLYKQGEM